MTIQQLYQKYNFSLSDPPLGKGGFGKVYKAKDVNTGWDVAIKKSEVPSDHDKYTLYKEVQLAKEIRHPNIVKYLDVHRINTSVGTFDFGIMEYINGGDLDQFMRGLPEMDVIKEVLLGILRGLAHLHEKNIVHRDLKPSNILIHKKGDKLIPKIIDFGISKSLRGEESALSNVIGSFEYMSPEQFDHSDGKITPSADIWSIGVIVYQLLRGDLPFGSRQSGYSNTQIMQKIRMGKLPKEIEKIPLPYRSIVRVCLVKDRKRRTQNALQLMEMLKGRKIPSPPLKPKPTKSDELTKTKTANLGTRLIAFLLDHFFAILLCIPGLTIGINIEAASSLPEDTVIWVVLILGIGPMILYLLFKDGFQDGQSWGKRIVNIKVINCKTGKECSQMASFFKNFIFYFLFLFPYGILIVINVIVMLFNEQNRGLDEMIMNTKVIKLSQNQSR